MKLGIIGLPGAGKTTIAHHLTRRYPLVCLTTDRIRLKYGFASGPDTLKAMRTVGEELLSQNTGLIFDGIHMMRKNRDMLRQFGEANHARVRFIHVTADPTVIKIRLKQRAANPASTELSGKFVISDEHYQRIISYYEPPAGEKDVVEVDTSPTSSSIDDQLRSLYDELDKWLPRGNQ